MDATKFLEALDELEAQKGISKQSIIDALKESLRKAYAKQLGGGDDADIRVEITEDPAAIKMELVKKVVSEVEDDYLEISEEDAKKINKKLKAGDEYHEEVNVEDLKRLTALIVKSVLRQKLAEAEKLALYESHKDKVGEMITGVVEKCDDRGAIVNIGRTSMYLSRRELIGDEMFNIGDPIRLYVSQVSTSEKGPMVRVSRSDAGYLRRLFEEEVSDIYNGTVIIKNLVREAGIRSKVAVYSNDVNVDCVGSCIGVNGSNIQKIVAQLGNSRDKEKIDIISYSPNDYLFIIDALRPASVTHIYLDEENKKAIAIVPTGQLSLAIGRKGANARLACKLTGWNIDIKEEHEMADLGVEFKSLEKIQEEEKVRAQKEKYEKYLAQVKAAREQESALESGNEKAKPRQILDEEVQEEKPVVEVSQPKVEEPVEEAPKAEVKETKVRTTTTLESLEAELDKEQKKEAFKATQKTSKRPRKITEDEVEHEKVEEAKPVKKEPQMSIYTEEELARMEEEEEFFDDEYVDDEEEIDYDEYDQYYDDDDK
ncbi:MAG: transcription termination/antitermination protein NusA [Bacilli bacterium]|nr:transcription termination/antitermination protein NusA [Bacilli bacterium]MBR0194099.1 transcription termination/antitermination protein NusA [Bacilli bacterium]